MASQPLTGVNQRPLVFAQIRQGSTSPEVSKARIVNSSRIIDIKSNMFLHLFYSKPYQRNQGYNDFVDKEYTFQVKSEPQDEVYRLGDIIAEGASDFGDMKTQQVSEREFLTLSDKNTWNFKPSVRVADFFANSLGVPIDCWTPCSRMIIGRELEAADLIKYELDCGDGDRNACAMTAGELARALHDGDQMSFDECADLAGFVQLSILFVNNNPDIQPLDFRLRMRIKPCRCPPVAVVLPTADGRSKNYYLTELVKVDERKSVSGYRYEITSKLTRLAAECFGYNVGATRPEMVDGVEREVSHWKYPFGGSIEEVSAIDHLDVAQSEDDNILNMDKSRVLSDYLLNIEELNEMLGHVPPEHDDENNGGDGGDDNNGGEQNNGGNENNNPQPNEHGFLDADGDGIDDNDPSLGNIGQKLFFPLGADGSPNYQEPKCIMILENDGTESFVAHSEWEQFKLDYGVSEPVQAQAGVGDAFVRDDNLFGGLVLAFSSKGSLELPIQSWTDSGFLSLTDSKEGAIADPFGILVDPGPYSDMVQLSDGRLIRFGNEFPQGVANTFVDLTALQERIAELEEERDQLLQQDLDEAAAALRARAELVEQHLPDGATVDNATEHQVQIAEAVKTALDQVAAAAAQEELLQRAEAASDYLPDGVLPADASELQVQIAEAVKSAIEALPAQESQESQESQENKPTLQEMQTAADEMFNARLAAFNQHVTNITNTSLDKSNTSDSFQGDATVDMTESYDLDGDGNADITLVTQMDAAKDSAYARAEDVKKISQEEVSTTTTNVATGEFDDNGDEIIQTTQTTKQKQVDADAVGVGAESIPVQGNIYTISTNTAEQDGVSVSASGTPDATVTADADSQFTNSDGNTADGNTADGTTAESSDYDGATSVSLAEGGDGSGTASASSSTTSTTSTTTSSE